MSIVVGTCGWSRISQGIPPSRRVGKSSLQLYSELFDAVEINSSFYKFHRLETFMNWRNQVRSGFTFTVKSHRSLSHRWRLRPTSEALDTFQRMVEAVSACKAKALLIQTPSSLVPSEDNLRAVDLFFRKIGKPVVPIVWETRGSRWLVGENRIKLRAILERHGLVHAVDLMKDDPAVISRLSYIRLHGLPGYNLRYLYTNSQLLRLRDRIGEALKGSEEIYVFFNNYNMYRDAQRFRRLVEAGELSPSPFGPRALRVALEPYERWPAKTSQLLQDCGRWHLWVKPDMTVRAGEILRHIRETVFHDIFELEEEAVRVWPSLGLPEAEQIESEYAVKELRNDR